MKSKKRPFLLLEVLLAITILVLFAAPIMHWPIKHYQAQIKSLETFEMQRMADWTFSEIKEMLFKQSIPWDRLPGKKKSLTIPLPDARLTIPHLTSRRVKRSCELVCKREKAGIHGETFRLYKITIFIDGKEQSVHKTLVQQILEEV